MGRWLTTSKHFQTKYNCTELLVHRVIETLLVPKKLCKETGNSEIKKLLEAITFIPEKLLKGTSSYSATRDVSSFSKRTQQKWIATRNQRGLLLHSIFLHALPQEAPHNQCELVKMEDQKVNFTLS